MVVSCRVLAVIMGAGLLAVPAPAAHAQKAPWSEGVSEDAKAKAKQLLDAGNALLLDKKYVEALDQYREAIKHWDHPAIRFNMTRCLIQLGNNLEAFESLERALKYGAAPHEATVYDEALAYQKLLSSQIGDLTVTCSQPGVTLTLDGKRLGTCPIKQTTRVLAGQHQVVGTKPGLLPKTVELVVAGGMPREVDVTLDPLEKAARIEHRWPQWIPWTVFGGGLAIAGVGAIFQVQARSEMDTYDDLVTQRCTTNCAEAELADIAHLERNAERNSAIGVSLMITGGAAVATGAVMVWLNRGRTVYPPAVEVLPMQGGAAMSYSGRF